MFNMENGKPEEKISRKKNFFAKMMNKLDKKLKKQAQDGCCDNSNKGKGKSCC